MKLEICTTLHLAYFHFQYAADVRVPDLTEVYKEGQAVVAKVIEVDKEKKRFLASLRMLDCYHGDTDIGIQITENYMAEKQLLLKNLENSGFSCYISQRPRYEHITTLLSVNTNTCTCVMAALCDAVSKSKWKISRSTVSPYSSIFDLRAVKASTYTSFDFLGRIGTVVMFLGIT